MLPVLTFKDVFTTVFVRLEDLEAGAGDSSKFLEWQSKMRQQDLDNKLADIERRRIEGMLSLEEAILARGNLVKENRLKVDEMKQEASERKTTFCGLLYTLHQLASFGISGSGWLRVR